MSARIDPSSGLSAEIRRIVEAEIDKAVANLTDKDEDRGKTVHEARKRFKKLRAALRLVCSGDHDFYARENARYRDLARGLAGGREASALVETVDRFTRDFPKQTKAGRLDPVRARLAAARDRAHRDGAGVEKAIARTIASCRKGKAALDRLALPDEAEEAASILAAGAGATVRAARKALSRAADRRHPEDFHDLRKAVKRHWTQVDILGDLWPEPVSPRRRALKDLGEALGDLNDIAVMRGHLDKGLPGEPDVAPARNGGASDESALGEAAALFRTLLDRKEKLLRKRCMAKAAQLFTIKPKAAGQAIGAAWRASSDRALPARALKDVLVASG